MDNLPTFRYLVRPLDQTDYYWTAVHWSIMSARLVLCRLSKMLQQEGVVKIPENHYAIIAMIA